MNKRWRWLVFGLLFLLPLAAFADAFPDRSAYPWTYSGQMQWCQDASAYVSGYSDPAFYGQVDIPCAIVSTGTTTSAWHFRTTRNGWYASKDFQTSEIPPPAPTCTAGTQHEGLWPPPGGGTVSVNGCCATPYMDFDNGTTGVEETGATCDAATNPPPVQSDPPPQAVTCHDDGTCTYCDIDNTGVCFDGPPPFSVSGGGDPPPATSSPPPPPSSGGGDPAPSSSTGGDGTGTGGGGTGTGTGGGGGMTGTGNPSPQPGDNGDWPSDPAHSTSSACTAGDACNAGQASGVIGQLYQPGSATIGSLYGDFKAQVSTAPLLQAGKNFFTVNASGTCPTWHIPGNKYWGEAGFDFAFFCDPAILAILAAAGWVVLAMGAFSAFRIAIY